MKMALLHNSFTNLTQERDQLQTRYTNLTEGRDQLQTSYTILNQERDQLQTSYNILNQERYQFQKRIEDMTKEITDLRKKLQDLSNKQEWVYLSGSFYHVSSTKKKSWQGSRDDCVQKGADLVIINSREEQPMWIGLTDKETEGRWKWVDGTLLTQSYWMHLEPNGRLSRDEDCAEISNNFLSNSWNDDLCNIEKFWICEMTSPL
ncbi:hypothetical protein FQN60_011666 [Etheostoma spectabile]|uniref:C-type lectin domain-containing protein n=1 Tax=Etheostoma spectabile TaxID=54343 RepID=A0A5J5DMD6_9PERO|nr:hypothetical protein FQN60_011666 [Etheostoma spectabile]